MNFLFRQGLEKQERSTLVRKSETVGHTFILVWVDDTIAASRSVTKISNVKRALEATFHKEIGFLGRRIRREEGTVIVAQECYIETTLERFQWD